MRRRAIGIPRYAWLLGLAVMTLGCTVPEPEQDAPPEGSYEAGTSRISVDGTTETAQSAAVSHAFFARETSPPMLGRTFVEGDYNSSSPAVAVVGYGLWTARFGASLEIIGREIEIDGTPAVVVGVMPRGFRQPDDTAVWLPRRPQ